MLILGWWDSLGDNIGIVVENLMRSIFYAIDTVIYKLIMDLYNIFTLLCNGRLLSSDVIKQLSLRVGTILGVIMMFIVIFSFIQLLVNPDAINDKEKGIGNIVKKVLVVIIMLGTYTYIFNLLTNIQTTVINSNAIANLLLPTKIDSDNFGGVLSSNLFVAFYSSALKEEDPSIECSTQKYETELKKAITDEKDFDVGKKCLYETGPSNGEKIHIREYNWLLCTIVGIVIAYFIFSYCISVGIRVIQLAVLQIIAPMPIVAYLTPKKDNMFTKWTKMYFTTYIDVFIRIAIINFVAYLIGIIIDNLNTGAGTFWESLQGNSTTITDSSSLKLTITVIMIIALLSFAKKLPELLKEFFPSSAGSIGFGFNKGGAIALGAGLGAGIGIAGRVPGTFKNIKEADGLKNKLKAGAKDTLGLATGAVGGVARGGKAGFDSNGNVVKALSGSSSAQAKANLARAQRIASGVGAGGTLLGGAKNILGIPDDYSQSNTQLEAFDAVNSLINGEDIVKDYELQRQQANKKLAMVQSRFYNGTASQRELDLAKEGYKRADAKVGAAKAAVYEAAKTGSTVTTIEYEYNGQRVQESSIAEIKQNATLTEAIKNAEIASKQELKDRATFKEKRNELQTQVQKNIRQKKKN